MHVVTPVVAWWGRLQVEGLEVLPTNGPTLVIANHDSHWDPLVIGVAALRRRQIRALAKSSLWRHRPLARVLDGMGQLPITRGRADRRELAAVVAQLAAGRCVGIFPEATISHGRALRAYSGAGWLSRQVPDVQVVSVAVSGVVDIVRFPRRPRIRVHFYRPAGGPIATGEPSIRFSRRVVAEIRASAPPAVAGRRAVAISGANSERILRKPGGRLD